MSKLSLSELIDRMRGIDFVMLSTQTETGAISARPMRTNGDIGDCGTSYLYAYEDARLVAEIARNPAIGLTFQGDRGLFGGQPLFVAVEGRAELIRDRAAIKAHWQQSLDKWYENGSDTPDIVLIKVNAKRLHYWTGQDNEEIVL